jgi:hypothetical protein
MPKADKLIPFNTQFQWPDDDEAELLWILLQLNGFETDISPRGIAQYMDAEMEGIEHDLDKRFLPGILNNLCLQEFTRRVWVRRESSVYDEPARHAGKGSLAYANFQLTSTGHTIARAINCLRNPHGPTQTPPIEPTTTETPTSPPTSWLSMASSLGFDQPEP